MRQPSDSIQSLARDLAARIRWEQELGGQGYDARKVAPIAEPAPRTARPPEGMTVPSPSTTQYRKTYPDIHRPQPEAVPRPASIPISEEASSAEPRDAASALAALGAEIGECTRCGLAGGRTRLVFGEGNPEAELVFVGEGPGRDEDLAGRPFVGAAGQLLDRIIHAMTLDRTSVYICNVVKCRPPGNRTPAPEEQQTCGGFARRQLAIIRPRVVVALGATAAQYLLDTNAPLGALRGKFHDVNGIKVMPTFHPAYLLRNPGGKRAVWDDMQMVMRYLGLTPAGGGRSG